MLFSSIEKSVLDISSKTLITGVSGTLLSQYFIGGGTIPIMGYNIPTWAFYMGVYSASAGLNETTKQIVLNNLPESTHPYLALQPVTSGLSASAVGYIINLLMGGSYVPTVRQLGLPFLIGAGSDILGSYVNSSVVEPALEVKKGIEVSKQLVGDVKELIPTDLNHIFDPSNFNVPLFQY